MSSAVYKIAPVVTCHAWNADRSQVALCPNNEEVHIYSNCQDPDFTKWKKEHTLSSHDLVVCGIDWSPVTNKIVTCSHDRNAFVWTLADGVWKPSLSILRINRAALQVRWSPDGKKFAVASGAKVVPVCHYEEANDWWISKMIKKHKSTVIDVAWHPNSQLLATASSDFRCRVFSAFVPGVDEACETVFGDLSAGVFGDVLVEFEASGGWVESVAWSPSGDRLAYAAHDSSLSFVQFTAQGEAPSVQTVRSKDLPIMTMMFLSEDVLVTGGHMFNPGVYQYASGDGWSFLDRVDVKGTTKAVKKTGFGAARDMWASKTDKGQGAGATASDNALWTKHTNVITDIQPYSSVGSFPVDAFSTSGLDGRIVVWQVDPLAARMSALKL